MWSHSIASLILALIAAALLAVGCSTTPELDGSEAESAPAIAEDQSNDSGDIVAASPEELPFPAFILSISDPTAAVRSPVSGAITSFETDPFGSTAAAIAQSRSAFFPAGRFID